VHGIDAAAASVQIAQLHAAQDPSLAGQLRYSCATAESLLGSGQQFDVVCALEVVEHVTHAPSFLQTMAALVKPGGIMFVSTMNQTNKSWMMAIVGAGAKRSAQTNPIAAAVSERWNESLTCTLLLLLLEFVMCQSTCCNGFLLARTTGTNFSRPPRSPL
jgi:cyclopropane fatty-acyl-phospholipid synthase-like methyltransferase